jgi:serine/threonine-protein kinase
MAGEKDSLNPDSPYRLVSQIAEGCRSRVYLADDKSQAGKQVAIKFLRDDVFSDAAELSNNLNHEAQCLALSAHANVVSKINVASNENGVPYLVMEYLPGQTLKQILASGKLDPVVAINLMIPLTHAIENMHKIGVLHLDLRPDKIIVDQMKKNPNPKLVGLGRAKFLPWAGREQTVEPPPKSEMYSLQYASPEQAMDKRCLPTSDVYSLGCILYEAITGRAAVQGENELHVMAQHLSGKTQAPSVVTGDKNLSKYDEVLMQSLVAETHKRFVDAAEMREALMRMVPSQSGWMAKLFKK